MTLLFVTCNIKDSDSEALSNLTVQTDKGQQSSISHTVLLLEAQI